MRDSYSQIFFIHLLLKSYKTLRKTFILIIFIVFQVIIYALFSHCTIHCFNFFLFAHGMRCPLLSVICVHARFLTILCMAFIFQIRMEVHCLFAVINNMTIVIGLNLLPKILVNIFKVSGEPTWLIENKKILFNISIFGKQIRLNFKHFLGSHKIEVTFGDIPIAGSPFHCEVVDPRKVFIRGNTEPLILRQQAVLTG